MNSMYFMIVLQHYSSKSVNKVSQLLVFSLLYLILAFSFLFSGVLILHH